MKHQKRRHTTSVSVDDPDFAEALCGGESPRLSERQAERKARQLCRQVHRALNLALADSEGIDNVTVEYVEPAPDCGRLLVYVVLPPGRPIADALAALRRETPRLRTEVAMAITRKRAPELSFVPAFAEGGDDE